VAIDETTGVVYVVDQGANRVARFSQSGTYLGELNGSGLIPGEETEAGAGGREGESGGAGANPGERGVPSGRFEEPEGIAVDNSCAQRHLAEPQCKEKDPSDGDVYVVDAGLEHRVIDKYGPEGKYLGQITAANGESFHGFGELEGVAVDAEGVVWAYRSGGLASGVIDAFTYKTPSEFEQTKTVTVSGVNGDFPHPGFAIDSNGNFYVRHGILPGRIAKLKPTGEAINKELDEEPSTDVAVEQSSDNALVENITSVGVFNAEGRELERLGEEGGAHHLSEGAGVAVDEKTETVFVADASATTGQVVVFGPQLPETPLIEAESVANISSDAAELGGEVNPRSETGEGATEYSFQYGACASASACASSEYESSTPAGQLEASFEAQTVSAHLRGLAANTTYHFRLLARNSQSSSNGWTFGHEKTFTFQGAGGELTLADNRAWELVSPPDKQGALILPIWIEGITQAAAGGGAIAYQANAPTEAGVQGNSNLAPVLSSRSATGWSSRDIEVPHVGATGASLGLGLEAKFYNAELTLGAVQPFGEFNPALSAEASESTAFLHELSPGCEANCFHPLVTGKAPFANVPEGTVFGGEERCQSKEGQKQESVVCGPRFDGASEDLEHVVLSAAELFPGAGKEQLYEWTGGRLAQVSVLPGGTPAPRGSSLGLEGVATRGAIADNGTRIAWEASGSLYLSDMALEKSVQLDKAEEPGGIPCSGCESGGGKFQFQSTDGTRVFFTDQHKLTEESGEPGHADLYECQIVVQGNEPTCQLSDLTPRIAGKAAEVLGSVLGASEDGSYLYFVARGVLSEGENARGENAIGGKPNLYLRHDGTTSFIATLAEGDEHDWGFVGGGQFHSLANQPTRVTPNGQFLELMSEASLTGYDNRDVATGKPAAEVYLYGASANRLVCASCQPTGARPVGIEYHQLEPGSAGLAGGPGNTWISSAQVAANVPGWTVMEGTFSRYQPRYLTDEGRLFFNSPDALVPQDTNGIEDVYQYEPPGVGSCSEESATYSARSLGCVSLISSGSSAQESAFLDASESGDDVFFLTSAKLSPLDTDSARDVYDAHVCSASSPCIEPESVQSPPCSTEASCKASPTPQPTIYAAPASATFQGPGNPPPAAPATKKKTAAEIKAEQLAKALKACRAKKQKQKRQACEKQARAKYGAKKPKPKQRKAKPKAKR